MNQTNTNDAKFGAELPADLPAVTPPSTGFFVQLFLLPATIVFGIMLVWFLFGKLAGGEKSPEEYVEIICSTRGDRWKAAHDLSQLLRNNSSHTKDQALATRLAVELQKSLEQQNGPDEKQLIEYLCGALGSFQLSTGVPMLRKAADAKNDIAIRRVALISIMNLADRLEGKLDDPNVVPELSALLKDENEEFRGLSALTLGLMNAEAAKPALKSALNDGSARVRFDAANALARMGDPAALPVLKEMLDFEGLKKRFTVRDGDSSEPFDRELVQVSVLTGLQSVGKLATAGVAIPVDVRQAIEKLADSPESAIRTEARNVTLKINP